MGLHCDSCPAIEAHRYFLGAAEQCPIGALHQLLDDYQDHYRDRYGKEFGIRRHQEIVQAQGDASMEQVIWALVCDIRCKGEKCQRTALPLVA